MLWIVFLVWSVYVNVVLVSAVSTIALAVYSPVESRTGAAIIIQYDSIV